VRGIANISGGGLPENLPRALAPGLTAVVRRGSWPVPPVFSWLERLGGIDREEMYRTFNMGVGMAVILGADEVDKAQEVVAKHGWESWPIGHVVQGEEGVRWA